jgi:hypothetical protein
MGQANLSTPWAGGGGGTIGFMAMWSHKGGGAHGACAGGHQPFRFFLMSPFAVVRQLVRGLYTYIRGRDRGLP